MTGWDSLPATADPGWETTATSAAPVVAIPDAAVVSDADPYVVRLGARPRPGEIQDALLALPAIEKVRLDASEVERLPGPVIQVLLSAMREVAAKDLRLIVLNPSFAFTLTFEAYGLGGAHEPFEVEYR